jgi:hypothetical protein
MALATMIWSSQLPPAGILLVRGYPLVEMISQIYSVAVTN